MSRHDLDQLISDLDAALEEATPSGPADMRAPMPAAERDADEDRLPWPEDWFDRRISWDTRAARSLWAALLAMLIREILTGRVPPPNFGPPTDARYLNTADFQTVCGFAGFDADAVRSAVLDALQNPERHAAILARMTAWRSGPQGGNA